MRWLTLFLGFILNLSSVAQDFDLTSINLTVLNGLAGDNVYCAMQDDKGYIWFGTETGVSRYNGRKFENFYMSDGLPDNEIFRIDQDSQGRIWFSAFNGKPGYYSQGGFFNASNDTILSKLKPTSYYLNLFEDSNQNIWFASRWGMAFLGKDGTVINSDGFPYEEGIYVANFIERDGEVWGGSSYFQKSYLVSKDGNGVTKETAQVRKGGDLFTYMREKEAYLSSDRPYQITNYLSKRLDDPNFIKERSSKIHDYNDGVLWACTFKGALKVDLETETVQRYYGDQHISHVLKDREEGYWFTTLGEGVYYVPRLDNSSITEIDGRTIGNTRSLLFQDETLWFGANKASFGAIRDSSSNLMSFALRDGRSRMRHVMPGKNPGELILVAEEAIILRKTDGTFKRLKGSAKALMAWGDSIYVAGTYASFFVLNAQELYAAFNESTFEENPEFYPHFRNRGLIKKVDGLGSVLDIEEYQSGLLISTSLGLYAMNSSFEYEKLTSHPVMNTVINDIVVINDSTYLLASSGSGTYLFQGQNWLNLSTQNGLTSDINKKVFLENDSTFWIATNVGVNKVIVHNDGFQIMPIGYTDGLISEDVNDLVIQGDDLIAATSKGISKISISGLGAPQEAPLINMKGLKVEGQDWYEPTDIRSDTRSLSVHFDGLHFRSRDALSYRYRLLGFDENWRLTKNDFVEFSGLTWGSYIFEVKAVNSIGNESLVAQKEFVIATPTKATWWFILIAITVVVSMLFMIVIYVLRKNRLKVKRQYEIQLRIAEAERKALQSQLNPHFIFNSLNSIQNMVLDETPDEAYQYLAKFSKLIRRVLELSDLSMISLDDEISTLRLYMDLENLRLNGGFEYDIQIEDDVDTLEPIPSMIMQPHVENAIWHGIIPLKGKRRGRINILIKTSEDGLVFEITDNGVGRSPVKENERDSFGQRIVNELVNGHLGGDSGHTKIIDLIEEGNPSGTKVIIQLLTEYKI